MKTLPEFESNPYVVALGEHRSPTEMAEAIMKQPSWSREDKQLAPHLRRQCMRRLKDYFLPGGRAVKFAEDLDAMVRWGYVARDASRYRHEARALAVVERARDGSLLSSGPSLLQENKAETGLLAGYPGMGKTVTVQNVLGAYPRQLVEQPDAPAQIVYLRLDTPIGGSLRGLCQSFFQKVDGLLGANTYTRLYAGAHATEDSMMANMAVVANYHAIGCLVVDEVQYLADDLEARKRVWLPGDRTIPDLVRFMVLLTNTVGVPVLFVGTPDARELFMRDAATARRIVGNFGDAWEPYARKSKEWQGFLKDLWGYQWTRSQARLRQDVEDAIFDETGGIPDLAVKLFMRVQMRLTYRTTDDAAYPEEIDDCIIRQVAHDDFKPVKGFLHALKMNDPALRADYRDLVAFKEVFENKTDQLTAMPTAVSTTRARRPVPGDEAEAPASSAETAVRQDLRLRGMQADVIDAAITAAIGEVGENAGVSVLLKVIEKGLKTSKRKGGSVASPAPQAEWPEADLRRIAREANESGRLVWEGFAQGGLGGDGALKLAA